MKKIALILAALVAGASLPAQAPAPAPAPAAPSYSVTADFTYTTKYVFRGVELAKGAFQPSLKITSGDFYASVWNSSPVDKGYELEFDYNAGYGVKLDDKWSLDTGLTVYTYPGLDGGPKATYEPYIGANGTIGVLASGTYAYYDLKLKVFTVQQTLGYTFTVDSKTSVALLGTLGRASANDSESYTYWGFGLTVPYKISDKATFTVGAQYADHNLSSATGNHFWGTADFNYAF